MLVAILSCCSRVGRLTKLGRNHIKFYVTPLGFYPFLLNNISINADLEENRLKVQKLHSVELIEKGILSSEVFQLSLIDSQKNLSNSNEKI